MRTAARAAFWTTAAALLYTGPALAASALTTLLAR